MPAPIRFATRSNKIQAHLIAVTSETRPGDLDLPDAQQAALREILNRAEFKGESGQLAMAPAVKGTGRVYAVGLGAGKEANTESLRRAGAAIAHTATSSELSRIQISLPSGFLKQLTPAACGQALAEGLGLGLFSFDSFKGKAGKPSPKKQILEVSLAASLLKGAALGLALAQSTNYARSLAATPPNVADPAFFVREAKKLARTSNLHCRIMTASEAKKRGMGGLLAVGQAGSSAPCLIILEYRPASAAHRRRKNILLVGKTITFDTGGYNLKPSTGITGMKYDKCGGMAVLGAMQEIARLRPDRPVTGILAVAENMVDRKAYRPDDIIRFCNGVTCEITNTDAEGRLVLADALAWATQHYDPAAVIDLATLTGGVVVALGPYCAGYFCNDPGLKVRLESAADQSGDKIWHLPLWPEHRKQMAGHHADLVNSQGRDAHPIQGAAFLSHFVGAQAPQNMPTLPWAHIDIAGVATTEKDGPLFGKGPTGFGVRLLCELIRNWK